ncbi:hypothetical protein DEO72_LG7g810 [Vigna unguiculata]|uniref:Uncharacterized protein n=1 Tax=Vigna unguiculata TaxID=3917 RepID=A0A4D6MEU7_VIGUN|nr:hypothetical protein DEO72_LG7g810 [Vigna unguiculata]
MAIQGAYDKVKNSKDGRTNIFKTQMIQEAENPQNIKIIAYGSYQRHGSLWRIFLDISKTGIFVALVLFVLIKEGDLCGKPSSDLSILLIVASLLSILIKEGP